MSTDVLSASILSPPTYRTCQPIRSELQPHYADDVIERLQWLDYGLIEVLTWLWGA
ncbi:MAG: hypothetical protein WBV28_10435 [Terracidiphilus sp.]